MTERSDQPELFRNPHAVDADLISTALRKVVNHQNLTQTERRALKRHEKAREEALRWRYYRTIPQKHWRKMSGRQAKVINEQASRYGLPFGGPVVDLPEFVRAFHDFLAASAQKLAREPDDLLEGGPSPALERYRQERAELARLDRMERQRQLLPRDAVRESLARIASLIRQAGERLEREFGPQAAGCLYEALDEAQREIERAFGKR